MQHGILVRNVTKRFPGNETPALEEVTFEVSPGEVVGLLGANGAGKTTLLRILSTLLRPSAGTAEVAGYDTGTEPRRIRSRLGALFGGTVGLYGRLTARENIRYFASLNGVPPRETAGRIEKLIELFGLQDFIDRTVGTFSSGMKQRTALARTVVHTPNFLLLDEPTTGLDINSALVVQNFIAGYRAEGGTVMLSSHNTGELEQVCDRVLLMQSGRIVRRADRGKQYGPGAGSLRSLYLEEIGMYSTGGPGRGPG